MRNYDAQEGKAKLKVNHKSGYYRQVQGQLVLSGLPWCNFVVSLTGSRNIYVQRIYFDKIIVLGAVQNVKSHKTALTSLKGDLSKYFLPINNWNCKQLILLYQMYYFNFAIVFILYTFICCNFLLFSIFVFVCCYMFSFSANLPCNWKALLGSCNEEWLGICVPLNIYSWCHKINETVHIHTRIFNFITTY